MLNTQFTHQSACNQRGNESISSQFIRINPATRKCWQEERWSCQQSNLLQTVIVCTTQLVYVCTTSCVTSCTLIAMVTHTHKLIPVLLLLKVTRSSVFTKEVITTGRIGRPVRVRGGGEKSSCGFVSYIQLTHMTRHVLYFTSDSHITSDSYISPPTVI